MVNIWWAYVIVKFYLRSIVACQCALIFYNLSNDLKSLLCLISKKKSVKADLYLALMVKVHSVDRLRAKRQYICRQSLRAQTNGSLAYWFVQYKNAFLCSFINNLCHLTFHIVIVSCTEFSFRAHTNIIRDMSKGMLDGNWRESKATRVLP